MSDVPVTDFEVLARWEWFRRADWGADFSRSSVCKGFYQLVNETGADVCLDGDCGFADNALYLHDLGLANVVCCDESEFILERAKERLSASGKSIPSFLSSMETLAGNAPHPFAAVFCPTLMLEPQWQTLHDKFCGIFSTLRPGGFLAFTGPAQGRDWMSLLDDYSRSASEEAVWSYRDGDISCTKVIVRGEAAENFADERIMHVINEAGTCRIESTTRRLPAYWSWNIMADLVRQSGFCHLEQRTFNFSENEPATRLIVAWKEGALKDQPLSEPAHYSSL